jgi:hypothetical protein
VSFSVFSLTPYLCCFLPPEDLTATEADASLFFERFDWCGSGSTSRQSFLVERVSVGAEICGPQGNAFFFDRVLLFGTVMAVSAGNTSFLENDYGFLVFAATADCQEAEPGDSGLFKHLPLVRSAGDSSSSGGGAAPSESNCLLFVQGQEKRMFFFSRRERDHPH